MMKKLSKYLLLVAVFGLTLNVSILDSKPNTPAFTELFPLDPEGQNWVDSVFNTLSLREKCAQLVFPYAYGSDPQKDKRNYNRITKLVEEEKVGGVLFLSGDIENQTKIINELQSLANVPLLISSDFERGLGIRLKDAVEFPYQMAFAAAGNPYYSFLMGKITSVEARALGVHQNYAPLVDVVHDYRNPIINIRAYSSDPDLISIYSNSFIRGLHTNNLISTAKHFPGHGATNLDSHNDLPLIELSDTEFWEKDLKTFKHAIENNVKSVMVGHLNVPSLAGTGNIPATFSYNIVTKILKNNLGFKGLIVTDALNMHAVTKKYSQAEIAVLSIQAGNDILLFPQNEVEMIDGLVNAVENQRLSEYRIDESVKKLLTAKKWAGLDKENKINIDSVKKNINKRWHYRIAETVAEKSITLVKDNDELVPFNPDDYKNIYSVVVSDNRYRRNNNVVPFIEELNQRVPYVKNFKVYYNEDKDNYKKILNELAGADLIIMPLYSTVRSFQGTIDLHEEQFNFVNNILNLDIPVIAISFGNPFLLTELPDIKTYITAYGNVKASQTAAVKAILGDIRIEGNLPVAIPNTDFFQGHGLEREAKGLYFQQTLIDSNYDFTVVDSMMNKAVQYKYFPGAVLLVGHRGRVVFHKPYGSFTYEQNSKRVDLQSIFDLASLTKVVATTSSIMKLYDEGEIKLDDKVAKYIPLFANKGKENITIKNLLLHNSGLPSWKPFYKNHKNKEEVVNTILFMDLEFVPGEKYLYSDLGMIVLQLVIEEISGKPFDEFVKEEIFDELDMQNTFFNPPHEVWYNTLPTERDDYWRMQLLKGKVHDEIAYLLEGVAGNAGLFSTAEDLAKIVYTLINDGMYGNKQIFKKETVELFTSRYNNQSDRALGWDTKSKMKSSAGALFSFNSFGHTGFTGTSIWADKDEGLFVILLTNRVHPTRENTKLIDFRPGLHDEIYRTVTPY